MPFRHPTYIARHRKSVYPRALRVLLTSRHKPPFCDSRDKISVIMFLKNSFFDVHIVLVFNHLLCPIYLRPLVLTSSSSYRRSQNYHKSHHLNNTPCVSCTGISLYFRSICSFTLHLPLPLPFFRLNCLDTNSTYTF